MQTYVPLKYKNYDAAIQKVYATIYKMRLFTHQLKLTTFSDRISIAIRCNLEATLFVFHFCRRPMVPLGHVLFL